MQVPALDLKAQYAAIEDEVTAAIQEVCESQMFCMGPAVTRFEDSIAGFCRSRYAVGVSSGTDALLISLMALDVGPGDEVITAAFSFGATAEVIARVGAKPVFVDVEPDTFNINPDAVEENITERTRVILPVHLFGQVARMEPIVEIARRRGLLIVEDACQSIGASRNGVVCGNFGELGCFSFYPTKNLGGFGDGGLVTTNDEALAEKLKTLRNHGQHGGYRYELVGGNFRLDSIQAAVLQVKLNYLEGWNRRRREIAERYDTLLADTPVKIPTIEAGNVSTYNQYTIRAPQRDRLREFLKDKGVGTALYYPSPLHLQPCFSKCDSKNARLAVSEQLCEEVLSLPIFPELTDEQVAYVASKVAEFYASGQS